MPLTKRKIEEGSGTGVAIEFIYPGVPPMIIPTSKLLFIVKANGSILSIVNPPPSTPVPVLNEINRNYQPGVHYHQKEIMFHHR